MTDDWLTQWVQAWQGHVIAGGPDGGAASSRILEMFSARGVWEDVAAGAAYTGPAELTEMFRVSYDWCPNLTFTPLHTHHDASRYAIEWRMEGRGGAAFGDLPAHDNAFSVRGVSVGEVDSDLKVARHNDYWNLMDWMTQCGHVDSSGAGTSA